jgi:hypothetical protein
MLHHDAICSNKLWDLAKPLQVAEPGRYRDIWQELRSESAPLRVVGGDQLVSAPISFFDSKLISYVTDDWQKVARAVGQALASQIDDCIIQAGDLLLVARVAALVESGRLEIRGEFANDMHVSEVRLPKPQ